MTREAARTTCTRSTESCREPPLSRRSTRTWRPGTAHASGRSMYVGTLADGQLAGLTLVPDPQGRRAGEECRRQATVHQAAHHQEPQLPAPPPRSQDPNQEGLQREAAVDFCLRGFHEALVLGGSGVHQGRGMSHSSICPPKGAANEDPKDIHMHERASLRAWPHVVIVDAPALGVLPGSNRSGCSEPAIRVHRRYRGCSRVLDSPCDRREFGVQYASASGLRRSAPDLATDPRYGGRPPDL